ncbi:DUF3429 domain-containing protein [Aurantimonas sp. 22II-16-19i]|uniref:DUF3429 domain-containing protein n=1 Tax=Aurantimonas sp. 22II-16-19i TaxID=1317114 RepID=UPI0009F7CFD2|nr:DUF3429 domain-containing protein [Aurantimonas sp. 22II-16-19i]ORE90163.1 hypothetical protein ATO4_22112 [Aurantimonas sp. 22II-16-19i]
MNDEPIPPAAHAARPPRGASLAAPHDHARTAWALALFGLVPFVVMAGLLAYAGREFIAFPMLVLAFSGYSATILAFLGGIRWGYALSPGHQAIGTLVLSVLPSLFGWALLFVPSPWVFAGFAAGFALTGVWDGIAARRGALPGWFGRLRLVLAASVTLCQIVAFLATWN